MLRQEKSELLHVLLNFGLNVSQVIPMPQTVEAKPEPDFWARMCKTKPDKALAELVWNALDADAKSVQVKISVNPLDGIDHILVSDNGSGILPSSENHDFSHLGGSWKATARKTKETGRILHGKNGQGRFRAFSLGQNVLWSTTFNDGSNFVAYQISGATTAPGKFIIGDEAISKSEKTGTVVKIENIDESAHKLRQPSARDDLSRVFAPYLNQYKDIKIDIDGHTVDSSDLVAHTANFKIGPIRMSDGTELVAELEIIEWKSISGRALYLCDQDGFSLAERIPEIRAPGFNFGAYLKSSLFRELDDKQLLDFELTESVTVLVAAAKTKLAEYFRKRENEQTASLIQRWKNESIYPFDSEPRNAFETNAQKIFNVCAVTIHEYASGFDNQETTLKALSFRLLKEAIQVSPDAIAKIMTQFLNLPKKKQEQFKELLDRTTLSSIIDAVHHIDNRIVVATALRSLVSSDETRNSVKEREHIHRIVEDNPWIFGEEFALGVSESSLTNLLREHLKTVKLKEEILTPVLKASGKAGRIDLMLAKRVKRSGRDDDDHLVIELKRANKTLAMKDLLQIKEYANVVMRDPKFNKTAVRWNFWLVGTELDSVLEDEVNSQDRDPGCAHIYKDGRGKVWVKTWGQLIHDALSRLEFVREKLNIAITEEEAVKVLERIYPDFVPTLSKGN
jgi:Histidine kinase-, DNA gyrase B-, and HSP90-like ATPase